MNQRIAVEKRKRLCNQWILMVLNVSLNVHISFNFSLKSISYFKDMAVKKYILVSCSLNSSAIIFYSLDNSLSYTTQSMVNVLFQCYLWHNNCWLIPPSPFTYTCFHMIYVKPFPETNRTKSDTKTDIHKRNHNCYFSLLGTSTRQCQYILRNLY